MAALEKQMSCALELSGLKKAFGGLPAMNDVSLSVMPPTPLRFSIIWSWACSAYAALLQWFPLVVTLMLGLIAPLP